MRSGSTTSYRSDIDGLRAVAVLPVVLYHSGLTVFSGGFVGVDIFFVISGYLITNIIWTEIRSSDFSILRFYERRARRILPALFVVILATLVAGSIWSLPQQLAGIGASSAAAVLSVSNFYFWSQSGYFSPHAEMLPLLHTWSLGVEEQFYLIFPLGMVLLHRLKLNPPMVIAVAIAPLFAVGVYLSYTMPAVSFYLLPARAWELLIGAVLALGIVPKVHNRSLREAMGIGGLSIIGLAIFMIDPQMRFPGFVALAPCIGAAALIHSGHVPTVASRLLSVRPMVFVGLISYSLYLWHWPLLAFTKMRFAAQHLTPGTASAAVIASFVLAWVTWRWVERPFRDTHAVPLRKLVRYSIGCAVFLISVGAVALVRQGFPQRLDPTAYALQEAGKDFDPLRERCAAYSFASRSAECRFGANNGDPTFVVWGDSHAAAMRPAIEIAMAGRAGSLWWQSGCPPLVGAVRTPDPDSENCTRFHQQTLRDLQRSPEIGTVFVVGRWVSASTGVVPEIGGSHLIFLIDRHSTEQTQAETFRVFSRSLRRSVRMLKAMGKRVVLVGAVPEPGFDVPTIAALARHNQVSAPISLGRDQVAASNARTDSVFRALSRHEGVEYVSMWEQFCDRRCPIIEDGVPLYVDDDHLTQTASARLGPYIASQLYRQ